MTKHLHVLKLLLIAGCGGVALTACVPGQYGYDARDVAASSGQYGADYGQANFGQYGGNFTQARYGEAINASSLRPPCETQVAPCGFMTVVPVYPIYQVAAPPQPEPVVEIFEPPTVEIFEPEPTVIYEPEPIYEPMDHWPEPETPTQSWKPIRK